MFEEINKKLDILELERIKEVLPDYIHKISKNPPILSESINYLLTEEISYNLMTEDMIEFIRNLKINKPIFYGFSDGGIVGLLIAIKEPKLLSKLIVSGANLNPNGMSKPMLLISKIGYFIDATL